MAHELIIRGGTVIDGTGAEGRAADVAVDGERVTAIGDLAEAEAVTEIDAAGLKVTPGFVDLHTHLDAQIAWDPYMTSSSWQGVTTALIGNCGFGFAPVQKGGEAYLAELMESVEDIPRDAIEQELPWDWESYPEYLDSLERMRPSLNVVGLVGHCAIRSLVMGDRSLEKDAEPSPEELSRMREIVAESVAGGAVGYSTSRLLGHVVPDGRCVPGTYATPDEHFALAEGLNDAGGGLFQAVPDFFTRAETEFPLLRAMAERVGDVLFTVGPGDDPVGNLGVVDLWDAYFTEARANAGRMTGYTMTRPSGTLMGLAQVAPVRSAGWAQLMQLPTLAARLESLSDAGTRKQLIAEGREKGLWFDPAHIHPLGNGDLPDYHIEEGQSLQELADAAGVHPIELVVDRLLESEGRELFNVWFFHRNRVGMAALLSRDWVYPSAADTGAHAGQICDADALTHFVSYWCRERGIVDLPTAVRRITSDAAAVLGLKERGTLEVGNYADINVFDFEGLKAGYPTYVNDFPNGKGRFQVRAQGYAATLVNGVVITEEGQNTGSRAGKVVREFSRG